MRAAGDPQEAIAARVRRGITAGFTSVVSWASAKTVGQGLVNAGERVGRFVGDKSNRVGQTVRYGARGAKFGRRLGVVGAAVGGVAGVVFAPEIQSLENKVLKEICGIDQ